MSDKPSSRGRPQFSVLNLMLAVACFAVAIGWVTFCFREPYERKSALILVPVFGPALGGGIGLLLGQGRIGALAGLGVHVLLWLGAVLTMYFARHT